MWPRQIGHFFFEPKGYDEVNGVTFETKEEIKVGFNLQRKAILFAVWLAVPLGLLAASSLHLVAPLKDLHGYLHQLGTLWLASPARDSWAALSTCVLTRNVQTGVVWFTKILTDPFHDVKIYHRAPIHLLKGEWSRACASRSGERRVAA